jgi:CO dehydrogenase/acetyl-CoA synthase alpha subunit
MSFSDDLDVPVAADVHGTPVPDMCCLCTMEDITLEDGNYGT